MSEPKRRVKPEGDEEDDESKAQDEAVREESRDGDATRRRYRKKEKKRAEAPYTGPMRECTHEKHGEFCPRARRQLPVYHFEGDVAHCRTCVRSQEALDKGEQPGSREEEGAVRVKREGGEEEKPKPELKKPRKKKAKAIVITAEDEDLASFLFD